MDDNHKRKIGDAQKRFLLNGGKHSKGNLGNVGDKCHFWKGGISLNPYPQDWNEILKESIRIRDNHICQICGIHQDELVGWNLQLDIHHKDYTKNNIDPKNLITLCRSCHVKTNGNRKYWIKYFE